MSLANMVLYIIMILFNSAIRLIKRKQVRDQLKNELEK